MRSKGSVARTCERCGAVFRTKPYLLAKGYGRYCGLACAHIGRRTRVARTCERCGAGFRADPGRVRLGQGRFCSHACAARFAAAPARERFWSRVTRAAPDACWLWSGAISSNGYGHLWVDGRVRYVHRLAYEWLVGPIPAGMLVCHRCDARYAPDDRTYRRCCNPAHLFLGTESDNGRDMAAKGRHAHAVKPERTPRGSRHASARLTEAVVRAVRQRAAAGARVGALAQEYGVDRCTLDDAIKRRTWRHVA